MPEATRLLDLTLSDEQLLAQMKPKGRYNIGLAQKHGVRVKLFDDVTSYAALSEQTARRDGFRGHGKAFYAHFLHDLPGSFLLLAYVPHENGKKSSQNALPSSSPSLPSLPSTSSSEPVAGLLGVIWKNTGIYYYGASSNVRREFMAPSLLQWEAMKLCRERDCTSYDLFGIAPEGATGHPWSGVSEFKAKFGGTVVTYPPEREVVLRPAAKKLLTLKRKFLG